MAKEDLNKIWREIRREAVTKVTELRGKIQTELDSPFWQEVRQRPRQALFWAETLSPDLARRVLSYASGNALPGDQGYSFELSDWNEEGVVATLKPKVPSRPGSEARLSEVVDGAERILRLFWERHLLSPADHLELNSLRVQRLGHWRGALELRYGLVHRERERMRIQAASEGKLDQEVSLPLLNDQSLQVGEVSFELTWSSRPAIG